MSDNRDGEIIRNGIEIVIIGAPNVGKSTLINQLARRDVALTSHVPGTTRDIIDIKLNISNIPVIFFDTAGIKKRTQNLIEKKGILKAREKMKKSDLKLLLIDATKKINSSSLELIDNKTIIVINKIDKVNQKKLFSKINELNRELKKLKISPNEAEKFNVKVAKDGIKRTAFHILSREGITFNKIRSIWPGLPSASRNEEEQLEISAHYSGYLEKQEADIITFRKDENLLIPENINYDKLSGLSNEVKSKFRLIKPKTLGQALRIDGITPAAAYILLSHVKRGHQKLKMA